MMRLSSGGLLALGNGLRKSSDIETDSADTLEDISDMIVRVFLPGDMHPTA